MHVPAVVASPGASTAIDGFLGGAGAAVPWREVVAVCVSLCSCVTATTFPVEPSR